MKTFRLTVPPISGILRPRAIATNAVLVTLIGLAFVVSVATGDFPLPLQDVVSALLGSADAATTYIVHTLRLPRTVVAVLAGAAFGMSGALFQALTRNPLASPDVIGIAQGASLAAVAGLLLGFGTGLALPAIALLGGLGTALVVYLLAWKRGTTSYRIVLMGIGVAALCTSATNYLLLKGNVYQVQQAFLWLIGNLSGRGWQHAGPLAAGLAVLMPLALLLGRWLRVLQLGDDPAQALGVPAQRARLCVLVTGVGLIAVATAAVGPVAFVALTAPQIAQRLARTPGPPAITSALTGALILLVSDLIARDLRPGTELPVGVVTGVVGGPYLLWLLARTNRAGSGG
jgi:iron complex transport system permease protein